MPRIVVIGMVVVLVLALVFGVAVLVSRFNTEADEEEALFEDEAVGVTGLEPAGLADRSGDISPDADDDGDGLSNADELLWQTDPLNPDTDGDGFLDGEEVEARHDPLVPAPNDTLDETSPATATTGQVVGLDPDQFLVDNPDLNIGGGNLTEDFEDEYKTDQRSPATIADFVSQQAVTISLPRPKNSELPDALPTTKALIIEYLLTADNPGVLADYEGYGSANIRLSSRDDPAGFIQLAEAFEKYRDELKQVIVPEEAVSVHRLLLGYAEFQATTFRQVSIWPDDEVKALVAIEQAKIADRTYYPIISDEFFRLEQY